MKTALKKNEELILVTRPHVLYIAFPFLLTLAALVVCIIIGDYALLLTIPFIVYLIYKFIEWRNNIWAVTNFRVIDEFGVFSYTSKESPLDKINNVSFSQNIWGKIFGFGDVQIQTAAEIGSTIYRKVSKPQKLKETITQMQEDYKNIQIKKHAAEIADAITSSRTEGNTGIAAELEKLHELKVKGVISDFEFSKLKSKLLNSDSEDVS